VTPDEAIDAKLASQRALDHGKAALAIQLGEHSVELDPTDADAWLVLGAAYLQRGAFRDARRCFSSCAQEATHGARAEGAALLR
jgi:Flp pilus assembly protein TadD